MTWELEGKILSLLLTGQFWDYYLLDDIGEELHVFIFEINLSSVVPVHNERSEPCHVFEINSLHLREEIEARAGILRSKKYQSRGKPSQDTYLRFEKFIWEILVESVFGIILVLTTSDNSWSKLQTIALDIPLDQVWKLIVSPDLRKKFKQVIDL